MRITFTDVSDLSGAITYRHVLLVEPDATRGFKPVTNHAGGLAWVDSYLFVADTSRGVRVFDLSRILQVSSAAGCSARCGVSSGVACAYGYSYVLPQVGAYVFPTGLSSSCRPLFSFVALDRSTSPPTLTGAASTVLRADQNDYGWMPEGMYISSAGNLWVSTEGHANLDRSVFFVRIANVP